MLLKCEGCSIRYPGCHSRCLYGLTKEVQRNKVYSERLKEREVQETIGSSCHRMKTLRATNGVRLW